MKKKVAQAEQNMWDIESPTGPADSTQGEVTGAIEPPQDDKPQAESKQARNKVKLSTVDTAEVEFDMEGLMTDFPTATELQKFVYDQTGVVLSLKGRANRVKYQVALDTLNGIIPPPELLGNENPYLDRNELVPEEPLRVLPPPDPEILAAGSVVNRFGTSTFPHPDPEWKAQDQKCQVVFRKYETGMITYEILGPIAQKAVGEKINKFGNRQPEKIVWIDPRQGEQIVRRSNGQLTAIGTRLKAFMSRQKVNKSNQWDTWIDRDFVVVNDSISDNPWGG